MAPVFHLALTVDDLAATRAFYGDLLGCREGRSTESWVDFDFFGHQLSLHRGRPAASELVGQVGDRRVPMPHFGVVLPLTDWRELAGTLTEAGITFDIEPSVRFEGEPGEQWTMFFRDPSGNPIEVKAYRRSEEIFSR